MDNMTIILGVISIFILLFMGGAVLFLLRMQKENNEALKADMAGGTLTQDIKTTGSQLESSQNFLPFRDIKNSMIDLGGHEYRMVVECNSINIDLKTALEQEVIEMSFQRFIHSMNYMFAFYVQTREIDNREIIENLKEELGVSLQVFPQLRKYATQYLSDLNSLNEKFGNSKYKKKYIILTFDEAKKMNELNDQEKEAHAFEELKTRAVAVINNLSSMGIKGRILRTEEVAEMVYYAFNKDMGRAFDGIATGEYFEEIVEGRTNVGIESKPVDQVMHQILAETVKKFEIEVLQNKYIDNRFNKEANQIIDNLQYMQEQILHDEEDIVLF